MKKQTLLFGILALFCCLPLRAETALEEIDRDKVAESLGHLIVRQLNNPGFDLNLEKVVKGIQDEKDGLPSPLNEEEYEQAVYAIQEHLFTQTADQNLAAASDFLEKNAVATGIQCIEPKLQYRIEKDGEGSVVDNESVPLIHYQGKLLDGTVFASSFEGGEPIALPIKQTIPGFAKGLVGMKEGEKRVLFIHPELAYGLSGHLPPNSLLIFEIEIVKANTLLEEVASEEDAGNHTRST